MEPRQRRGIAVAEPLVQRVEAERGGALRQVKVGLFDCDEQQGRVLLELRGDGACVLEKGFGLLQPVAFTLDVGQRE